MVHKPSPLGKVMESAPWRIFHYDDKEIMIDVDGGITIDGHKSNPFPCQITHAAICDAGLVATWVDHDLRLARMALLPLSDKLVDGVTKAELRASRDKSMVANSQWCHIVDAEPLALTSTGDKIIFALWSRGLYCIDSDANEIWRLPLFDDNVKKPPRSNEVAAISVAEDNILVWSRGGTYREISLDDGTILKEETLEIECDLEEVFNEGNKFLLSSKDGWAWELQDSNITIARKLRGTIQDAAFDGSDWRIISWRDDLMLRGETIQRSELGVQIINKNQEWLVLDNQGKFSPHMANDE